MHLYFRVTAWKTVDSATMVVIYTMRYYDFAIILVCVHTSPMSTHTYMHIYIINICKHICTYSPVSVELYYLRHCITEFWMLSARRYIAARDLTCHCVLFNQKLFNNFCETNFRLYVIAISRFQRKFAQKCQSHVNYPTLFWACDYLPMLGLKLIHVNKRGRWNIPVAATEGRVLRSACEICTTVLSTDSSSSKSIHSVPAYMPSIPLRFYWARGLAMTAGNTEISGPHGMQPNNAHFM